MPDRAADWFAQARRDLDNARYNREGKYFEWACFAAQQAAEKALKAVYQSLGGDAWGHSVLHLVEGLSDRIKVDEELHQAGRELDRFQARGRNRVPQIAPGFGSNLRPIRLSKTAVLAALIRGFCD